MDSTTWEVIKWVAFFVGVGSFAWVVIRSAFISALRNEDERKEQAKKEGRRP
jgi:hypothetical protein